MIEFIVRLNNPLKFDSISTDNDDDPTLRSAYSNQCSVSVSYQAGMTGSVERKSLIMNYPEPTVSITSLNGRPVIKLSGDISTWHLQSVEDIVENYLTEPTASIIMDTTDATFTDFEAISMLIRAVRSVCMELGVTIVAEGRILEVLMIAGLEPQVAICRNIDQAAESVKYTPQMEYLTSRWVAKTAVTKDFPAEELRLAA